MNLITISQNGPVASVTLNRPEKRNALNDAMVGELQTAYDQLGGDDSVRVIILKAAGAVFSAGADLAYLQKLQSNTYAENLADSQSLMRLFESLYRHPKLLISQVEGHAIAGGCGLATVMDLCYAVPEAQFGYTEVKIGFIPAIVMFFLLRKIGETAARRLLLTGDLISAEEAARIGLITGVMDAATIALEIEAMAKKLSRETSPQSIARCRTMIAEIQSLPASQALQYAAEQNAQARGGADCKRGIAAFLSREKLDWSKA